MPVLSTKQRKKIPRSSFAIPEKAPGSGSYPIPDEAHARNALARVQQHGSAAEKRRVYAAVRRKFPGIEVSPLKGAATGAVILQDGEELLYGLVAMMEASP